MSMPSSPCKLLTGNLFEQSKKFVFQYFPILNGFYVVVAYLMDRRK